MFLISMGFEETSIHRTIDVSFHDVCIPICECKVLIRKIHQSVCRMTGKEVDNVETEYTLDAALEMDEKFKCDEFAAATKQFVLRLKGTSDSVHDDDRLVYLCNWDCRGGKQPLSKFLLVFNILYDKCCFFLFNMDWQHSKNKDL
ncbi:uncharacterized protein LOC128920519 [Zeugodacus cucurbitae]|uniref:uncharacterized protein LOC128920519 n=1 Tax=Zeugodacus cucurbitae TaxID=28588 RepID=UPI0023D91549|nr:uncharacterized protein LOC128920519 [Zeugodacus cucurbitae]